MGVDLYSKLSSNILNKNFSKVEFGYSPIDVDGFLDLIAEKISYLQRDYIFLEKRNLFLQKQNIVLNETNKKLNVLLETLSDIVKSVKQQNVGVVDVLRRVADIEDKLNELKK